MEDQLTEPLPPHEAHRNRSGGPNTPEGKATSSMNRLTHGCRSEKTILPDEKAAEFDALAQDWFHLYQPDTPAALVLVEKTVRAQWFLRRAEKQLEEIEWNLPVHPFDWNDAHHSSFEKFSRYKTTRERSFLRFYKELEAYYGRVLRDAEAMLKSRARLAALEIEWLGKKEEKVFANRKLEQYVDVTLSNGKCETAYYPTNEKLIQEVAKRPDAPIFVTRWITFCNGVPAEYDWCNPNKLQQDTVTNARQTMTYMRWLQAIKDEKTTGHLGPFSGHPSIL